MTVFPTLVLGVSDAIAVQRENLRGRLAIALIVVFALVVAAIFLLAMNSTAAKAQLLITGVLTPVVALVGSVVGFYFGSRSVDGGPPE